MKLKIISGGQTGVDQAALRAAKALGIETGGTMPRGWLTEDGPRPEFAEWYGMTESTSPNYVVRTEQNVRDADVTLWVGPAGSRGYYATRRAASELIRLFVVLPPMTRRNAVAITDRWLDTPRARLTINVAGSRESRAPGIGSQAERDLTTLFRTLLDAIGEEGGES